MDGLIESGACSSRLLHSRGRMRCSTSGQTPYPISPAPLSPVSSTSSTAVKQVVTKHSPIRTQNMTHSSLYLLLIKEAFANCMQGMTASTEKTAMALTKEKLPLRMMSTVVRGFKRGSTELGIPTANLDRESGKFAGGSFDDLPTGIYWGFCRIGDRGYVYKTACSIGYNPTYNNTQKTVEPHLIAHENDERRHASSCGESVLDDFYSDKIRLSLVGFLRPELPYDGIEKLITAIKKDIADSDALGNGTDESTLEEKAWVSSEEDL